MGRFCSRCGALLPPNKNECVRCSSDNVYSERGIFPYKKVRPVQEQLMDDSRKAFNEGKIILANAPTGIGKTAAVLTAAAEVLDNKKLLFLTSKQSQHRMAIETVKKMPSQINAVDVIAKQHMCPYEESRMPYPVFEQFCERVGKKRCNLFNTQMKSVADEFKEKSLHVHEVMRQSKRANVCPHKTALSAAKDSEVLVCDFNYVFSDIQEKIFEFLDLKLENTLLIVDEAHNLPDRVRSQLESSISIPLLKDSFRLLDDVNSELAGFVKRFSSLLGDVEKDEKTVEKDFIDDMVTVALRGGFGRYENLEELMVDLEVASYNILEHDASATAPLNLYNFFKAWREEGKEVFRGIENDPITVRTSLLDPSRLTKNIFSMVGGAILMSGTLHPGEMYADLLGIKGALIKNYPSPFPEENRMILSVNGLTTSYKQRGMMMYQAYANAISDVANNTPGNTAAFFPSYGLLNRILERLRMVHLKNKLLIEDRSMSKVEKESMVDALARSPDKLLIAVQGGSLSEGVDYPDNMLSAVIIVGIPFPPPSLELKALEDYYTDKFGGKKGYLYTRVYPALNRVLQAAGRSIRSKEDRAVIVLMDERFNKTFYRSAMPDRFDYELVEDMVEKVKEFFE